MKLEYLDPDGRPTTRDLWWEGYVKTRPSPYTLASDSVAGVRVEAFCIGVRSTREDPAKPFGVRVVLIEGQGPESLRPMLAAPKRKPKQKRLDEDPFEDPRKEAISVIKWYETREQAAEEYDRVLGLAYGD